MAITLRDNRIPRMLDLSRHAFGQYKWQIILLTALGFVSGILEGIGVNALIPLFSFIMGQTSGSDDIITRNIERLFSSLNITFSVKYLLLFIVALFVVKAIVVVIFNYIRIKIDTDYEERTRNKLFASVLRARWPYLLRQKIGYLETVLMTDVLRGSVMLRQIGNIIMVVTGLLMYTLIAINISFAITMITLALGAFLFLLYKPLLYRTRMVAQRAVAANKVVAHYINQCILGMKAIKSMHTQGKVTAVGEEFFGELKELKKSSLLLSALASSLLQPISLIFIVVVFAVAYKMPEFNFAALIAIMYLIQRMFQHIQNFQANVQAVSDAIPYLQTVIEYQKKADEQRERDRGGSEYEFRRELTFKNVGFEYHAARPVLRDVIFTARRGEMVGIVGQSGAGKTTIVDLLLRLFRPSSGEILLDGKNIDTISLASWRKNVGYVSQDVFLLNASIAENIRFFDDSISDRDVEKAARMANIHDFIKSCPDGFGTVVGERGIMLSAGQRQRVAIARVLVRNPKLLILDEATSALDNESEAKVQEVIENLRGKVTVLIVAHRLSTVMNADTVIVLDSGRIVEEGSPKDMLADTESYFYKLSNIRK